MKYFTLKQHYTEEEKREILKKWEAEQDDAILKNKHRKPYPHFNNRKLTKGRKKYRLDLYGRCRHTQ